MFGALATAVSVFVASPGVDAGVTSGVNPQDTIWVIKYQENFIGNYEAENGEVFGTDGWLTYRLINGGTIVVEYGYAQLYAPDFWNAALIRSTNILPDEYKIRAKIGHVNYDLDNYDQADFDNPDFNDHSGHYENGVYFLTITDDTCSGNECAEEWWHYHRKAVIDVDNHIEWGTMDEIYHPLYMVYMAPETNSGGNLLRTWTGTFWDDSDWNWNVAYTYEDGTWYYAELEKRGGFLILRLFDASMNIIEETTPVDLTLVNAMDNPIEYLHIGEPHTDDYEGDVRIDEITLFIPAVDTDGDLIPDSVDNCWFVSNPGQTDSDGNCPARPFSADPHCGDACDTECCVGLTGNVDDDPSEMIDLGDLTALIDYLFINFTVPACIAEANIDGSPSGTVDLGDLTALIDYLFISFTPPAECL